MSVPSNDLNISVPGYVSFDGISTFAGRTLLGGAGVTITNGNGISGNTTIALTGGGSSVQHLTGNTGGSLNPDGSNNFNTLGTGSITIAGLGSTLTTQLTGLTNHAIQIGAGTATLTQLGPTATAGQVLQSAGASADPAFSTSTYPSTTTINQILYSSSANTVAGLATANRGVLTTGATGIPIVTALATDGQLIIGSTAGAPAASTLTPGTGISITNGSNSISIAVSGTGVGQTITGDSGGALSPTSGNWNLLGSGSITTSGSGSTLTTQLTGLTNHALLIGAGTTTITKLVAGSTGQILQTNTTADPTWSTSTYPSTATGTGTILRADGTNWLATTSTYPNTNAINTLLYASSANIMSALATTNRASLSTNSTGVPTWLALTDGQLVIGSSAGSPAASTLSAGTGITITNASNNITISASSSGFTWNNTTGTSATLVAENGYFSNNAGLVTYTLPTIVSSSQGDTIKIIGLGAGGWTIALLALEQIIVGSASSTIGVTGSVASTNRYDCIELVYSPTSGLWRAENWVGNLTVT